MCCIEINEQLGPYLDNELTDSGRTRVHNHVAACPSCRWALEELRKTIAEVVRTPAADVPETLWVTIEQRLYGGRRSGLASSALRRFRVRFGPWAIAAGIVLGVGMALLGLSALESPAHASTIDFGVLLDALPLDAPKAFRKFLVRYDATDTTPAAAKRNAPDLNFDTPSMLPGGFHLRSVYELRIGGMRGIAAAYERNGEFLGVVFHPPTRVEKFGTHQDTPCVIGAHCGQKIQIGEWKLVHLADETTCHCLLSRLDDQGEMPAVFDAIAPRLGSGVSGHGH